ncbi:pyrroloquinoline quinone precursor peptide PqqA [Actinoalloteichus caeruleus]|uniref:Coenzyme PQQ synthesis protein A n=1 Tax=Actinoalloteichus caeruleus DSM 43889 TaxID=1120930 RepID=A0ABT1JIM9_ACTCY|nr:coenzyme PQQ precursor peptide PqqA [Actinoalloteichus caeruleus DSM 43889]
MRLPTVVTRHDRATDLRPVSAGRPPAPRRSWVRPDFRAVATPMEVTSYVARG